MSIFRFYLDSYQISEPDGWGELTFNVNRDLDNNFVYSRIEGSLKFTGSSYDYFNQIRLDNLYCNSVQLKIDIKCSDTEQFVEYFNTVIYLIDCEFNTFRCEVTAPIKDNGWATKIQKNKKIEAYINTNISKNLQPINGVTANQCLMFAPNGGAYQPVPITGVYKVYYVLENLVKFMSDGQANLQSNFFDNGVGSNLYLVSGENARKPTLDINSIYPVKVSFESLYATLRSKYNVGMAVTEVNGVITVIIEDISYFYNANSIFTLLNIKDEIRYYKSERIFSSVNLGNSEYLEQAQCNNGNSSCTFPQYDLQMFADENFGIIGDCNVDNVLQLSSGNRITADTNVIEDCVIYQNTSHDQSLILVECDDTNPLLVAEKTAFGLTTTYTYNYNLRNAACADRWLYYGICNKLANYTYSYDEAIQKWDSSIDIACIEDWAGGVFNTWILYGTLVYDFVISNPNFIYDPVTGIATVSMPGIYTISASVQLIAQPDATYFGCSDDNISNNFPIRFYINMVIKDNNGSVINEIPSLTYYHDSYNPLQQIDLGIVSLPPTDYLLDTGYTVEIQLYLFQLTFGDRKPIDGGCHIGIIGQNPNYPYTYFRCTAANQIDSGEYPVEPENCKVEAGKFNKYLSFEEFKLLKSQPAGAIDYTIGINNEPTRTGFIHSSTTNLKTLSTEFDLLLI